METKFTYYLGLDMGTDSLGWAVTDSSYHIFVGSAPVPGSRDFSGPKNISGQQTSQTARSGKNWRFKGIVCG